jgi:hypothetical protein
MSRAINVRLPLMGNIGLDVSREELAKQCADSIRTIHELREDRDAWKTPVLETVEEFSKRGITPVDLASMVRAVFKRAEVAERTIARVRAWTRAEGCAPHRGLGTYGDAYRDAKEDVKNILGMDPCGICVSCVASPSCELPFRIAGEEVGRCQDYLGPLLQEIVPKDVRKG